MLKRAGLFAPLLPSLVIDLFAFPRPAQACSCVTPDPTPAALCRRTQYFGERQPARPILADGGGTNYGGGCLARTLVFWLQLCRARFIGGFFYSRHSSPALFPHRSIGSAPLLRDAERYRLTEGHSG